MIWLVSLACSTSTPVSTPTAPTPPPWPMDARLWCAPACATEEAARTAVHAAIVQLTGQAATIEAHKFLDPLIGLAQIRRAFDGPPIEALQTALAPVDRLGDPRRRAYDATHRLDADPSKDFDPALRPLKPNPPLVEALYCSEWGFRPATAAAICTAFRDDGGVYSAHAAWYLSIAIDNGCIAREATCLDAVRDELTAAALRDQPLQTTKERDIFAEQVLFALAGGADAQALAPAVPTLLALQLPSGAFGLEEDRPSLHATLVSAWALSDWIRGSLAAR